MNDQAEQKCGHCNGARVEPGHDDCTWCDSTGNANGLADAPPAAWDQKALDLANNAYQRCNAHAFRDRGFHVSVMQSAILNGMCFAAHQPPALGGEPRHLTEPEILEIDGYCIMQIDFAQAVESEVRGRYRAHLAPLQAENSQLRQHKIDYMEAAEETRRALQAEIAQLKRWQETVRENSPLLNQLDQLKARCDELHRMLGLAWIGGHVSAEDCRKIDDALSKPAGSEKV